MRDLRWFLVGFLIAYFLILATHAAAEERKGVCQDVIGVLHERFPVDDLVALMPEKFCGSHLDGTFSMKVGNLKKLLDTGKVTSWQVDLFNGPGLRNGQLGPYEPHAGMTSASFNAAWEKGGGKLRRHLRDRVRLYCAMFEQHPGVALEMSPTLEHNLSSKAFKQQAAVIRRNCPRAVIVDNPVKGVASTKGFLIERHGTDVRGLKAPCNVSLDGSEAFDSNVPLFLAQNAECTKYLWSRVYNGRLPEGFVDPRQRNAWPTRQQLRTLLAYAEPLPYSPLVEGCVPINRPRLWKVSSDDKGSGDVRANKPLWITLSRFSLATVLTAMGNQKVATLSYYGPFEGGTWRYYSGLGSNLYGIEMAERSLALSGSPYVVLREPDGRCFGPFHPAHRHGYYR